MFPNVPVPKNPVWQSYQNGDDRLPRNDRQKKCQKRRFTHKFVNVQNSLLLFVTSSRQRHITNAVHQPEKPAGHAQPL